ncbi:MAG: N-acetylmuramoyl-L-alanine amidase [bacterium]
MPFIRTLLLLLMIGAACARGVETAANPETVAWVPVTHIMTSLGLTQVEHLADGLLLSNVSHSVHLFAGRRSMTIDGATAWLHLPPRDATTNDLRDVARVDFETLLQPILLATSGPPAGLRIVLDAGHGGDDTGARSAAPEIREKDVALDITHLVAAQLTAAGQHVFLSRPRDAFETLGDRTRFAAAHQAQVFVSIHANSARSNQLAMGAETYILPAHGFAGTDAGNGLTNACAGNRFDAANARLGFSIHRRCAPLTGMDRGLKRARYFVLKEAPCPAVLVECGFLTNTNDTTRLGDPAYRRNLADAIAAGILDYTRLSPPRDLPPAANAACRP